MKGDQISGRKSGRGRVRTAREEVVDVLAEALWTRICSGEDLVSLTGAGRGKRSDRQNGKEPQSPENTWD